VKRLTILRHAKSDWGDPGLDDFDRPLNERGRKAARRVGEELKRRKIAFDQVIASPAVRVRETLERFADGYGRDLDVRFAPDLYLASSSDLLAMVQGLPDELESPLIVGHNPGLEMLVQVLTRDDDDGLRAKVAGKFPTGAAAVIDLEANRWSEVVPGTGTIAELILPRELD
jgi:phosphohistidine phosphatase